MRTLAERGATPTRVTSTDGNGRFVCDVPGECETVDVVGTFLEAAYGAGYFRRPRETTGEELADDLGICGATLSQHVRAAQHNLLSILYEERT